MKDILEDLGFTVLGILTVIVFCIMYWIARLFGVDLNEDF